MEQGGQRAGVRLAEKGGVQGRCGHRESVDGRLQGVCNQRAGVRLGGLQPRDGGVFACELAQRRDPCRYVQGVLVHHRLKAVVGGHRGQCGVVGRGDGTVHGRRGAVVGQLQVHAVRGALGGHHALQHVEGRLVCLVGEARGQRALQRGDAASVRSHLRVPARAAAVARGAIAGASALLSSFEASSAVTLSSRDWMAAALLPAAAVFTARSVT